MPIERLTDAQCRSAKPGISKKPGKIGNPIPKMYNDGKGLLLRVSPGGSKSWVYRYKRPGHRFITDVGLGPYPEVSLAEARDLAMAQRRLRRDDKDPLSARKNAKARAELSAAAHITFREAAEKYIAAKEAEWSKGHRADIVRSLNVHAYPILGNVPAAEIDTPAVMRTIEPKWLTRTETMSRVRSRIEAVLGYAVTSGYRAPGDNPARWDKHLENLLPKKAKVARPQNFPALGWQKLPAFMAALRERQGLTARALEFVVLTAARAGEVMGATWSEISLEDRAWRIPPERMKAGREHRVPLSDAAIALLGELPRDGDLVFGRLVNNSLIRLLDRFGLTDPSDGRKITVHGFRATFKTWSLDHDRPKDLVEIALAHKSGDEVAERYTRTDLLAQRRRLADDWARHCDGITEGANVVSLHA
jgi:integrase